MTRPTTRDHRRPPKPNRDVEQAGWAMQNVIATNVTAALDHLARELSALDGHPERGEEVAVSASAASSSVERTVLARESVEAARERLRGAQRAALDAVRVLNAETTRALRVRVPRTTTQPASTKGLCCDGQQGKDGAQGDDGWGSLPDEPCMRVAYSKGLCLAHYQAWRRWKRAHGIDVHEPGEPESGWRGQVRVTELPSGVAIVRPVDVSDA